MGGGGWWFMAGMDNNNNVSGDMADSVVDGGPLAKALREHLEEYYNSCLPREYLEEYYNLCLRGEIRRRWLYGDDQGTRAMEEKESG